MCQSCWEEYESPKIMNEKTIAVVPLMQAVYDQPDGGAGGNLHIVLDDWNIEDSSIRYCMDTIEIETYRGEKLDTTLTPIELKCAEHLLTMTLAERASAMAMFDRFFGPDAKDPPPDQEKARVYMVGTLASTPDYPKGRAWKDPSND